MQEEEETEREIEEMGSGMMNGIELEKKCAGRGRDRKSDEKMGFRKDAREMMWNETREEMCRKKRDREREIEEMGLLE
ncbi:hypothetical protein RRG08_017633 [Elysia crispata]|uniref:Uncharacterized protein n=1 Tax=Elysia crispata TaxID=231223 RepID=A0AAE1CL57_9GAST|nr:hypothetical protein RRG08_017633 [Elysia crispata]